MVRSWSRLAGVVLVAWLVAGCGASSDVDDVEAMLVERYLEPLAAAGIQATIESSCRYDTPIDGPWHLSAELRLDAEPSRVSKALKNEGVVVVGEPDALLVQQMRNDMDGWNGSLK